MQVEIWSDVVCPFCYLGKRRFEEALSRFPQASQVEVVWRSFELDPQAARDQSESIVKVLADKYGRTEDWARQANADLARQAAELGLNFDFDRLIPTNSFDAHRLLQLASESGLQDEMQEKLFSAFFVEGRKISEHETLKSLAAEAGLAANRVAQVLAGDEYADVVRGEEAQAREIGLNGVPAYVFDRKFLVSGAQSPEYFLKALEHAWAERGES